MCGIYHLYWARYVPGYVYKEKNSGGSSRRNRPANDVLSVLSSNVETVILISYEKPEGCINVKMEFGKGVSKVPLGNIAKRANYLLYKIKEPLINH